MVSRWTQIGSPSHLERCLTWPLHLANSCKRLQKRDIRIISFLYRKFGAMLFSHESKCVRKSALEYAVSEISWSGRSWTPLCSRNSQAVTHALHSSPPLTFSCCHRPPPVMLGFSSRHLFLRDAESLDDLFHCDDRQILPQMSRISVHGPMRVSPGFNPECRNLALSPY